MPQCGHGAVDGVALVSTAAGSTAADIGAASIRAPHVSQ
jgi:hypothetical protein